MRTTRVIAGLALSASLLLGSEAFAYVIGAPYSWGPGDPSYSASAVVHPGTIGMGSLVMGDFMGRSSSDPNAGFYGSSGPEVGWDDNWIGPWGHPNTNGDRLDGLWVQIYSDGGWWDLGAPSNRVAVFTSQDHGPYLGEGLEYRVFGTNTLWDDGSLSGQAPMTDVYLDGWRLDNRAEDWNQNGWLSDDIAGVVNLDGAYRYVKLVAWGGGSYDEPEIDAVASVIPEPSTLIIWSLLGALGIGVTWWRRRRAA